ncbi:MAG: 50S ribosomal protein L29 [Mycoplasma sp.]
MNKIMQELNAKNDIELASIVVRLNSQLLESRFLMASGAIEKTHKLGEIRQTIARCLMILRQRNFKLTTGVHGVYLINLKDNKSTDITTKVNELINNEDAKADQKQAEQKVAKKEVKKATKKEAK